MKTDSKRLTLFAGHYGSGKTNIAVNYAYKLAREGKPVCIADLDTNVDLPALPAESYRLVQDKSIYGIMDIGGDDRGAYALGRFADAIKCEDDYRMTFVVNCYRPLTATVEDAIEIMREIEAACGIRFNCIVNNSNLGEETTAATVRDSLDFVDRLSRATGLEIWMHTAEESVAEELSELSVMPLSLQKKKF